MTCRGVDLQGVRIHAVKAPTDKEQQHDFPWRVRLQLLPAGSLGLCDRSPYEDILIHRVRGFSTPEVIEERYGLITEFANDFVADGTTIIKVMLPIGAGEQKVRLQERLDRSHKHWKNNPGDVDERMLWSACMEAYPLALERASKDAAPWNVVPADRKWYARLRAATLADRSSRARPAVAESALRRGGGAGATGVVRLTLVDMLFDAVQLEKPIPTTRPEGWRARLEAVAKETWELYLRHPWLLDVDTIRSPLGPGVAARYGHAQALGTISNGRRLTLGYSSKNCPMKLLRR